MSGYLSLANGKRVAIRDGFVLGRVAGCDLVLDDGKASRRHARLHVEAGVVEIEDLQSSNGTLLNDKPVTRRMLRDGDRVQIGTTVIVYRDGELPGQPAGAPPAAAAAPTAPASGFDDNDLFDGAAATSISAPPPAAPATPPPAPPRAAAPVSPVPPAPPRPVPPPAVAPAAAPAPVVRSEPPRAALPSAPPAVPPVAKPPQPAVVEFADEIVEIRKPAAAPAARAAAAPAAPTVAATPSRVLQFHKHAAGSGGVLGDDLGQMSGGMRALLVLGALALGGAIVWLVATLVR